MVNFVTVVQFSPKMLRNESVSMYVYADIQGTYYINTDTHKAIQLPFGYTKMLYAKVVSFTTNLKFISSPCPRQPSRCSTTMSINSTTS